MSSDASDTFTAGLSLFGHYIYILLCLTGVPSCEDHYMVSDVKSRAGI